MATRILYLVRHGNYNTYADVEDNLGGPLTALGEEQCHHTGKYLSEWPITKIFASPMRRAQQSTAIIHEYMPAVPIETREDLWEVIPVIPFRLEGNFHRKFPDMTANKLAEQASRAESAFKNLFVSPKEDDREEVHEAVICHGNLIRYLICRALGVDTRAWANMIINQGSISRVMIRPENDIMLYTFNESQHMPEHLWVD